jgi:hypothetical protein
MRSTDRKTPGAGFEPAQGDTLLAFPAGSQGQPLGPLGHPGMTYSQIAL